jgi:quercetin dioxygenase-like cupin family protein
MDARIVTNDRALVSPFETRQWFDTLPGERVAIHVRSRDVGGEYSMIEVIAEPDYGVPLHIHGYEAECFHIIRGCVRFRCDGADFDAPAGTTVVIPQGSPHAWRNLAPVPAAMLVIFTPGGLDELFEEVAGRSLCDIESIAQRYGSSVVGPMIEG